MKATGIVRRIDDLGRVVIPKEIRRTMRIREGDPLEIYTDTDGQVIFKKYSPMGELSEFAAQICDALHKTTGGIAAVCDRDAVIAVAGGGKRELLDIMSKNADCIYEQFMKKNTRAFPGHPEVELALMRLWRATGNEKYKELAKHFVDVRGQAPNLSLIHI